MSESVTGQTQGFSALVSGQAAVVQAQADPTAPLDFSIGSVLRAMAESAAWLGLWLQGLILQVLTLTRASTSSGSDLDSWMADFGVTRIPGTYAEGQVTFARYTATSAASIPVGAQLTSADGTQIFKVQADVSQATYVASGNAYVIPAGVTSATVTVQNTVAGPTGNVGIGLVSILSTPISGVDYVSNAAAMSGGTAPETDAALRARFQIYINTRAQATAAAIGYAVSSTADVSSYTITQNQDYAAPYAYDPGSFYVVVDDGSGNPPGSLISTVATNVAAVAGCGIRTAVYAALRAPVVISMTVTPAAGYNGDSVAASVQTAVTSYVGAFPLGTVTLSIAGLSAAAVGVTGVGAISAVTLNGSSADFTLSAAAANQQVIRATSVTVSV